MGVAIESYTVRLPERERPSFVRLARQITTLTTSALALKEGLHRLKRLMERDAGHQSRLAELCDAAEVEPRFTALIQKSAESLRNVAAASADVAGAADDMATHATEVRSAHEREYRRIYEAVRASGVRQAKPGFYRTR